MCVLCSVSFTNGLSHHSVLRAFLIVTGRVRQPLPELQFSVSKVHVLQLILSFHSLYIKKMMEMDLVWADVLPCDVFCVINLL